MRLRWLILPFVILLLAGCGSSSSSSSSSAGSATSASASASTSASSSAANATQLGFEGVAIEPGSDLASPGTTSDRTVDRIPCGPIEQLAYHIHAHLSVFVGGQPHALPGGIGIPSSQVVQSAQGPVATGGECIYWLHTHAPDGVIHVESPSQRIYTLGNFFDIWHQALGPDQIAGAHGKVTAIVNGKAWNKDPRSIPLTPHAVIQLSIGSPAPPYRAIDWSQTQL
ncbi:MAG: hypothetical protein JO153_01590 [Solirubrobacterales bacterium]|nr:hypothetical protein [Solirubrobacterales bacterium]